MNFYLDTEFFEDFHKPLFGKQRHFIDLISIGITDDLGGTYYAVCNEFDLKAVWNKYEIKDGIKEYWLRENVLYPIFVDLLKKSQKPSHILYNALDVLCNFPVYGLVFNYENMKQLLKQYGLGKKTIATEILNFTYRQQHRYKSKINTQLSAIQETPSPITFYAYYADYDWVLFCSLFGTMVDLPKAFPKYCRDLKQMLDMRLEMMDITYKETMAPSFTEIRNDFTVEATLEDKLFWAKNRPKYPKQTNEHNALADAKWNKELFNFIEHLRFYHE